MAAAAGLRRVGTEAERGLREEGGDWRVARDPEPLALFSSRVPPPTPPTPHTPCLPVSLGNLQLKASHPHGNMYPSNKKKKVWREEKGNWPVESWGCGGWGSGGGGGQGCVCRGALRPSSRLAPARPVPPPSRVRVYTRAHAHTRAHTSVHAPPPGTCSSRTCGRTPLCCLPRPVTFSPCGAALAWLVAWIPARQFSGAAQLAQVPHPLPGPHLGLSDSRPGCPRDTCPPAGTRAAAAPPRQADPHAFTPPLCPPPPNWQSVRTFGRLPLL